MSNMVGLLQSRWEIVRTPEAPDTIRYKCTTPFVTMTPAETILTHQNLQRVVRRAISDETTEKVILDLDNCAKCDPGGLLLLRHAGEQLRTAGRLGYVTHSEPSDSFDTIIENQRHLWERTAAKKGNVKTTDSSPAVESPQDGKYLLRSIENRNEMVQEIGEWAEIVKKGADAAPEDVACWEMQIAEVATNTFQHGRSEQIWVSGHFYKQSGVVQLAAIDYGATIPAVIRDEAQRQGRLGTDSDLIAFACELGVTSRCVRQNQGSGLVSLIQSVGINGGRMQILSRNGFFHVNKTRKYRKTPPGASLSLHGTLIILCLKVR